MTIFDKLLHVIDEYLSLIRLTKEHIQQHFASDAKIETSLKLKTKKVVLPDKPASSPPPPLKPAYTPIEKREIEREARPPPPVSELKEAPKGHEIKKEILPRLKELFPEVKWVDPPQSVIDMIFLGDEAEAELYSKIAQALGKQGIQCLSCDPKEFKESLCSEGAKAIVVSLKTLLSNEPIKKLARRDESQRPHLGATPILIAPPQEELISREQKRQFWDKLLHIVTS